MGSRLASSFLIYIYIYIYCFPTHPSGSLYSHFKKQSSITARYPKYLAILKHKLFFKYLSRSEQGNRVLKLCWFKFLEL